jgi:hypothetical protein
MVINKKLIPKTNNSKNILPGVTSAFYIKSNMKTRILLLSFIALSSISAFAQNVPSYVPSNGLVGWWPFNGNANDESGNGNNGTVNGSTLTTDRFGNNNQAYNFLNSSILVNNPTGLPTGNAPYSLSCWFNNFNNDNGSMIFYGDYQQNQANGLRLAENYCNNSVGMPYGIVNNWFFNDCGFCTNDSTEIKRNFWNHVLITFDGNQRKLYLNNQLKATCSLTLFQTTHKYNNLIIHFIN